MGRKQKLLSPLDLKNRGDLSFGNLRVPTMPHFEEIMERYRLFGVSMSNRNFYENEVKPRQPEISQRMWQSFMAAYNRIVASRSAELVNRIADEQIETERMQDNSMRKLSALVEAMLDEIVQNPDMLRDIPIARRISLLKEVTGMTDRRSRRRHLNNTTPGKTKSPQPIDGMYTDARYGDSEDGGDAIAPGDETSEAPTALPMPPREAFMPPMPEEAYTPPQGVDPAPESVKFDPNEL